MDELLDTGALERSSVVANCAMNRERGLRSYSRFRNAARFAGSTYAAALDGR